MSGREQIDADRPVNPAEVENAIRACSNEIGRGVRILSARLAAFREAERVYDLEFAKAYLKYEGPAHSKKYAAEVATSELRKARDDAEGVYRHAERAAKALETELSAWQTINKTVAQMFGAAGHQGQGQ